MKEIIYEGIKFKEPDYSKDYKCFCQKDTERAIKDGILKRQNCEICGKLGFPHHEEYSDPLKVRWLCRSHHLRLHGIFKKLNTIP